LVLTPVTKQAVSCPYGTQHHAGTQSRTPHTQRCSSIPSSRLHSHTENRFAPLAMALAPRAGEGCFNATQQYLPWFSYRGARERLEKLSRLPDSSTRSSHPRVGPSLAAGSPALAEKQPRLYRKIPRTQHCRPEPVRRAAPRGPCAVHEPRCRTGPRGDLTTYAATAPSSCLAPHASGASVRDGGLVLSPARPSERLPGCGTLRRGHAASPAPVPQAGTGPGAPLLRPATAVTGAGGAKQ